MAIYLIFCMQDLLRVLVLGHERLSLVSSGCCLSVSDSYESTWTELPAVILAETKLEEKITNGQQWAKIISSTFNEVMMRRDVESGELACLSYIGLLQC